MARGISGGQAFRRLVEVWKVSKCGSSKSTQLEALASAGSLVGQRQAPSLLRFTET